MPTENEFKIVLKNTSDTLKIINAIADNRIYIEQAYIKGNGAWQWRVRKSDSDITGISYLSTIKLKKKNRLIELNQEIDKRDYDDIVNEASSVLYKYRYEIYDDHRQKWEVDIFQDPKNKSFYFTMAELEVPEGVVNIEYIPPFIQDHALFYVPQEQNNKYSSKKMVNVKYADKLRNKLMKEFNNAS